MDNQQFLNVISNSFKEFLASGTSTSTAKLKPLHGEIAQDIAERLGDGYTVFSQGYGKGKEAIIEGRYINKKSRYYHKAQRKAGLRNSGKVCRAELFAELE